MNLAFHDYGASSCASQKKEILNDEKPLKNNIIRSKNVIFKHFWPHSQLKFLAYKTLIIKNYSSSIIANNH